MKGKAILPDIAEAVQKKLEERGIEKDSVTGIGIGVPGPINAEGIVPHTANLGWGYKEVTRELTELTGLVSKGGNDANVAALGEMWKGAAAGHKSGVMVTLGTGVGGGIIIDGKIIPEPTAQAARSDTFMWKMLWTGIAAVATRDAWSSWHLPMEW